MNCIVIAAKIQHKTTIKLSQQINVDVMYVTPLCIYIRVLITLVKTVLIRISVK